MTRHVKRWRRLAHHVWAREDRIETAAFRRTLDVDC
jgi:hypothetical protein